jgi:hypothetical protein
MIDCVSRVNFVGRREVTQSYAKGRLELDESALQQMINGQADHEGQSDIPQGQAGGNERREALALVLAEVARPQGKLRARQKQDDAEHFPGVRRDRAGESFCKTLDALTSKSARNICTWPPTSAIM